MKSTFRKTITIASAGFGELKFQVREGTKLINLTIERDNFPIANDTLHKYALREQSEASIGSPITPGTLFFQEWYYDMNTSGASIIKTREEINLRNKRNTSKDVYFQYLNSASGEINIAVELECDTPN